MRILIAPDKFKGALNARDVAENIAEGLHEVLPNAEIEIVPMADGGEGTAEAICEARSGSWLKCKAHDPIGREIEARYAWIENGKLAVMEMSEAAGMRRLSENERDPVRATTFGVGEMILDAKNRDANEIIIGLGGSATNDGGSGNGTRDWVSIRLRARRRRQRTCGRFGKISIGSKSRRILSCRQSLQQLMCAIRCSATMAPRKCLVRKKARAMMNSKSWNRR